MTWLYTHAPSRGPCPHLCCDPAQIMQPLTGMPWQAPPYQSDHHYHQNKQLICNRTRHTYSSIFWKKKGSIQIPFLTNFETVTFIPQTILIPHPYDTTQCTSLTKPRCRHITGNNAASSLQGNHYIFLRSACSSDPGLWALEILCLLKTKCAL